LTSPRRCGHHLHGLLKRLGRAELDHLGPGGEHRRVAGRRVVDLAGGDGLLAVGGAERDAALDDDAPVRRLAAVVGQAAEERGGVDGLVEALEPDRVLAELLVAPLEAGQLLDVRRRLLADLRHAILLLRVTGRVPRCQPPACAAQSARKK
jgi:hypothetical protein